LGERLDRTQEVAGSSPASSISLYRAVSASAGDLLGSVDCASIGVIPNRHPETPRRTASGARPPEVTLDFVDEARHFTTCQASPAPGDLCSTGALDRRRARLRQDPLNRRLDDAPPEDEEIPREEEAAVQEAGDELAAGAGPISHE
jgi:hypothetical protein